MNTTSISPTIYPGLYPSTKTKFLNNLLLSDTTRADMIISVICEHFDISPDDIKSQSRKRVLVEARQIAMFFIKAKTTMSLKAIGNMFGGRDHSTVIYGCQVVEDLMDTDNKFKKKILDIQKILINLSNTH